LVPLVSSKGHRSSGHCDVVDIKDSNHIANESSSLIRIGDVSTSPLVIGRVELLKAFHAACNINENSRCNGDDEKKQRYQKAHRWGVQSLSRRLLKFSKFGMQIRGEYTIVRVNGADIISMLKINGAGDSSKKDSVVEVGNRKAREDEWDTPAVEIKAGDIVSFEPRGVQDLLEFKVVLIREATNNEQGYIATKCRADNEKGDATIPKANGNTEDKLGNQRDAHRMDTLQRGQNRKIDKPVSNLSKHVVDNSKDKNLEKTKYPVEKHRSSGQEKNSFFVHFFPFGNDFSASRRQKIEHNFELLGATIEDDVWKANHIVISETIRSLAIVAKRLRVSEKQLRQHLEENAGIRCVLPSWADHCITSAKCLEVPSQIYLWRHGSPSTTTNTTNNRNSTKRKRDSNEVTYGSRSEKKINDNNDDIIQTRRQSHFPRNVEVAEAFKTLGKLHQSMPLLPDDQWKSYCFRIVAGRLLELDFEVDNDFETQRRLRAIKGFGKSVCEKIQECIDYGTITRINEFESDEQRQAMKKMKDIWGVGPVKARELIGLGHKTIIDVRDAICQNQISFVRNQLVGVDCYEDILERMSRSEAEKIGEMVRLVAERLFPGMEAHIMGSYRRGKDDCGDVDILLCHPDHVDTIPTSALGQIVDALWNEGKISMHLTFLVGMTTGCHYTDYEKASRYVPKAAWERAMIQSKRTEYEFYMGCLNSPIKDHVRRRVDIKFYPYRERAFAMLYFTGNGKRRNYVLST